MKKNDEYMNIMVRLGKIDVGIQDIKNHLATLNGKVAEHERKLTTEDGKNQGIGIAWKIFITVATFAIGILTIVYFK